MGAAGSSAAPHPALALGEGALLSAALAKHAPGLPPAWGVLPAPALARVGRSATRPTRAAGLTPTCRVTRSTGPRSAPSWRVIRRTRTARQLAVLVAPARRTIILSA